MDRQRQSKGLRSRYPEPWSRQRQRPAHGPNLPRNRYAYGLVDSTPTATAA